MCFKTSNSNTFLMPRPFIQVILWKVICDTLLNPCYNIPVRSYQQFIALLFLKLTT
jgi:hypothetical protein